MSDGPTATFVPVTLREPPPQVHWGPEALRMSGLEQMRAARVRLIHGTRSTGLAEAFIEDGRGRLLAHATSRCILTPIPSAVAEALAGQPASEIRPDRQPDPYSTQAEGEVYGQEVWDTTPG